MVLQTQMKKTSNAIPNRKTMVIQQAITEDNKITVKAMIIQHIMHRDTNPM